MINIHIKVMKLMIFKIVIILKIILNNDSYDNNLLIYLFWVKSIYILLFSLHSLLIQIIKLTKRSVGYIHCVFVDIHHCFDFL